MNANKLVLILLSVILSGCAPKHDDPMVLTYPLDSMVVLSAQAQAKDIGGRVYSVADTHSMEPVLRSGDYVVVDLKFPYADLKPGQIITYNAGWSREGAPPVTHRTRDKTPTGWTVQGDNNNPDELAMWRVGPKDYIGKVVGIYRLIK